MIGSKLVCCFIAQYLVTSLALIRDTSQVKVSRLYNHQAGVTTGEERVRTIPFVTTVSTAEHGRALSSLLLPEDRVLELGSQLDTNTRTILDKVSGQGRGVFVDVKRTETLSGRSCQGSRDADMFSGDSETRGNTEYIEIESFSQWKSVLDGRHFDVLVLDSAMLGNTLSLTTIQTVFEFVNDQCRRGNQPRTVIVKSKTINSLARRLIHSQRLQDGSIQRNLKAPARDGKPYIVASVGVEEYRRSIPHAIKPTDECIEIGCFSGRTTNLVDEAARYCIGVDIGPKIIRRAKNERPHLHFEVGDGWNCNDLLRMKRNKLGPTADIDDILSGFDVVYADIGGLSGPDGTLESLSLLDALSYSLRPRCIVIKSLCMRRLASSLRPYATMEKSL